MAIESVTLGAAGTSPPIDLSRGYPPTGLLFNVPAGVTVSASVNVAGYQNGPWNPHDTMVGMTASQNGNIQFSCGFVQLVVASFSGPAGSVVTLTVMQGSQNSLMAP